MKRIIPFLWVMLLVVGVAQAQPPFGQPPQAPKDAIVDAIIKEATENSQLEKLGHELMDGIGPRLVGSPKMHCPQKPQYQLCRPRVDLTIF